MSLRVMVYVLTALAALVVALTRLRLRRDGDPVGRSTIARGPVAVHTVCGVLAVVAWLVFLVGDGHLGKSVVSVAGLVALVLWWVVALTGLLILLRWLPNRGRHASPGSSQPWATGPGLSVLGHVGMAVGAVVFTYAYVVL